MDEKAQISFFLVVAVSLLVIVGVAFFVYYAQDSSLFVRDRSDFIVIENYISLTLQNHLDTAISFSAWNGGRIYSSGPEFIMEDGKVTLFKDYGALSYPSRETIMDEVVLYLIEIFETDFDLQPILDQGYNVEFGELNGWDLLKKGNDYQLNIHFNVLLVSLDGSSSHTLNTFSVVFDARYFDLYNKAVSITHADSNYLDLFDLSGVNMSVIFYPYDEFLTIFTISDDFNENLIFRFGLHRLLNSPPRILPIPDQLIELGDGLGMFIDAYDPDGDELIFMVDNDMFFIDPFSGYLSFYPYFPGKYSTNVIVRDVSGLESEASVTVYVDDARSTDFFVASDVYHLFFPTHTSVEYTLPIFSTNDVYCDSYSFLLQFSDCTFSIPYALNLVPTVLNEKVYISDDFGNEKEIDLKITFYDLSPFKVQLIPDLYGSINELIRYQVVVFPNDGSFQFFDNSSVFNINPTTGLIEFSSAYSVNELVEIRVRDARGYNQAETFELVIS